MRPAARKHCYCFNAVIMKSRSMLLKHLHWTQTCQTSVCRFNNYYYFVSNNCVMRTLRRHLLLIAPTDIIGIWIGNVMFFARFWQSLTVCHDQIAMKNFLPVLPDISYEVDEDDDTTVKVIRLVKVQVNHWYLSIYLTYTFNLMWDSECIGFRRNYEVSKWCVESICQMRFLNNVNYLGNK